MLFWTLTWNLTPWQAPAQCLSTLISSLLILKRKLCNHLRSLDQPLSNYQPIVVTQVLVGICHNTHPIYQSLGVWGAAIDTRLCHSLDPRHMPIHYEILDAQGDRCLVSWTNLRSNIKQEQKSSKSKKDVGGVQKASFFENMGVAEVPRCCTPIHRAALGAVLDPRPVHSAVAGF